MWPHGNTFLQSRTEKRSHAATYMPHVPAVKGTIITSSTILVMILNRSPLMEWVILYLKPSLLSCSRSYD